MQNKENVQKLFYRPIVHIFMIVVVGLLAYSNTFHVPFIFDDHPFIVDNPIVKDFRYFLKPSAAKGFDLYDTFISRYIGYLTFALDYKIHGLDVVGFHVVNLAIHLSNALLVFWLVLLTFRTPFFTSRQNTSDISTYSCLIPLFSALLFVSHPIQTQAVTYIYQRLASLVALFYLLSLVLYIKARLGQSAGRKFLSSSCAPYYLLSLICAVLAMKTKENALTLPVMIAFYEFMFLEGRLKIRILYLLPFLLTTLIIPLSFIGIDKPAGDLIGDVSQAARMQTEMSRWDYLITQFRVVVTYLRLLFLPINQNLDYDYPIYQTFFKYEIIFSLLFLLSIISLALYLFYHSQKSDQISCFTIYASRIVTFGIFWFFIAISVESSFIPIKDVIFEHRLYLPSIGFFIAFSCLLSTSYGNKPYSYNFRLFIFISIIFPLMLSTYIRNNIWATGINLWKDVVQKSPYKSRGHSNLCSEYKKLNMLDKAKEECILAIRYSNNISDLSDLHNNLGRIYAQQGSLSKAEYAYKEAIKFNPHNSIAYNNLGLVYLSQNNLDQAIKSFNKSIETLPNYAKAHYNLGRAYALKHMNEHASEEFKKAHIFGFNINKKGK